MTKHASPARDARPGFMVTLGLLPPYLPEDVRQAYLELARKTHPDAGGSVEQFLIVQQAYEQAQTYLEFREGRREWIAARVDRYQQVEESIAKLRAIGAEVVVESPDWLNRSFGDFAQIIETVDSIRLTDSPRGNELIEAMLLERRSLDGLRKLNLAGCRLSDAFARRLKLFPTLTHLNLSRTSVTTEVASLAEELPELEQFLLDQTGVGSMRRWFIRRGLQARLKFAKQRA